MNFESNQHDPLELTDQDVLESLDSEHEGLSCPDFTRSVMGRLGYMNASAKVCRRRRIRTFIHRGSLAMAAMIALAVGIQIFNQSPEARRPVETSIQEI